MSILKKQRYRFKLAAFFLFTLFLVLGVYGVWSVVHYGSRWFSYSANPRLAAQKADVVEGSILDRNGIVLAETVDGNRVFQSASADRKAVVHLIGDREGMVANSVETFQAAYLYGYQSSLQDAIYRLLHPGTEKKGNDVRLTIDAKLCTAIPEYFSSFALTQELNGAAVVLNYQTGEIVAEISLPSFDPNNTDEATIAELDHPYWNRAVQGLYPPGSTFKIVTSAAALEKLPDIHSRTFTCTGSLVVSETLTVKDYHSAIHGSLSLRQAFLRSCNPVYASLALEMGDAALRSTAESFGFNQNFLFRDLVLYNSSYPTAGRTRDAIAASGYGQSAITITPMHLCLISAAVARGGVMPEPRLLRQVQSASGGNVLSFSTADAMRVCDAATVQELQSMMQAVVQEGGSGSRAAVSTLDIRGKTGTAESTLDGQPINYGWFTGYNAQADLPFAVCVLVEGIPDDETGGTTAAAIAQKIFTYLKNHPDRVLN